MPAPTDLAAALLRDVKSHYDANAERVMLEADVLAALSAHLDADLAERAGDMVERLTDEHLAASRTEAADLITALLAQLAALRAERDRALASADVYAGFKDAAEAREERLRGALEKIASAKDLESPSDYNRGWNDSRSRLREIARAALTTEADNG